MKECGRRIAFVFPSICKIPVGGFKVAFEYANRFAQDGYDVSIIYPRFLNFWQKGFIDKLRTIKWAIFGENNFSSRNWFNLDDRIKEHFPITLNYREDIDADIYVSTACITAKYVDRYPKGTKKFYFIQDYETWILPEEGLRKTYSFNMKKIVISNWLHAKLKSLNCDSVIVPNGFDPSQYYMTIPIEMKKRFQISVLYNTRPTKDFTTSYEALMKVHNKYPDKIKVEMFGTEKTSFQLPSWINFHFSPSYEEHLKINNESSIYLASSYSEGWGLTIGEAMMCGQAVVCTDANGFLEMAVHERNALVSPVRDSDALAHNIMRLFDDDDLRCELARNGVEDIKKFSVEESYKKFRSVIEQ